MSYYPEPYNSHINNKDSHINNKVKIILDLTNHATKKELNHATGVDTFNLAAKRDFIALAEIDKLEIDKLVNVPSSLNNLKGKVDDFDIDKMKIVPVDF